MAWLPAKLPAKLKVAWEGVLTGKGPGGVAATKDHVVVADRDLLDKSDCFRCFKADTGEQLWTVEYPAEGDLDYGAGSRATPILHGDLAVLAGAFGHLRGVELATGKVKWELNQAEAFGVKDVRKWGFCSSPVLVAGKLIVNPGGPDASLVALDPLTGKVLWKTPGQPAAYGSFLAGTFGGKVQVIGFDDESVGGWDVATGKRLWTYKPLHSPFSVPTPVQIGEQLLLCHEAMGCALHDFDREGKLVEKPVATFKKLAPDSHTPVVVGNRVLGIWNGCYCLEVPTLKPLWESDAEPYSQYCSIVASADRALVTTLTGELILLDAKGDKYRELGRLAVLKDEKGCLSHPALVGKRLYLRGNASLYAVELE